MAIKPVVVYVEEGRSFFINHNPLRDALVYVIKEDFGCNVFLYENIYQFLEDSDRIRALKENGLLILLIIKQDEYAKDNKEIVQQIRQDVSASLPIVIIPDFFSEEEFTGMPGDSQVFIFDHSDIGLGSLVKGLVANFKPPQTAVEIESPNKVLPEFIQFSSPIYDQESAKIRAMSDEDKEYLTLTLRHIGGSWSSLGDNVWGFAIDPLTLEYTASNEFGTHDVLDTWLEETLEHIEAIRRGKYPTLMLPEEKKRNCRGRVLKGYVYPEIEGFIMPIFKLSKASWELENQHIKQIAAYFKTHRKMLPITIDGQLIEG